MQLVRIQQLSRAQKKPLRSKQLVQTSQCHEEQCSKQHIASPCKPVVIRLLHTFMTVTLLLICGEKQVNGQGIIVHHA